MAISSGQVGSATSPALSLTVSAQLCQVPAGPADVVISNNSGGAVIITAGVAATQLNGTVIPTGGVLRFSALPGSRGAILNVLSVTGSTISGAVGWLISNSQ
jgi:hypothetical protein